MNASITLDSTELVIRFPYDPGLVAQLKGTIPPSDRAWDAANKAWRVAPQWGGRVADLIEAATGYRPRVPQVTQAQAAPALYTFEVRYLGKTRERDGEDQRTALGFTEGGWNAIFTERILLEFFLGQSDGSEALTLYGVLGVQRTAGAADIKTAYRRLARTWHPDICKEPNAREMFQQVQHAYEVINNEALRARYDAGLALEASLKKGKPLEKQLEIMFEGYRAPYLCGVLLVEATKALGKYRVTKIIDWQDIYNNAGQVLTVSWPMGAERWVETWQ